MITLHLLYYSQHNIEYVTKRTIRNTDKYLYLYFNIKSNLHLLFIFGYYVFKCFQLVYYKVKVIYYNNTLQNLEKTQLM